MLYIAAEIESINLAAITFGIDLLPVYAAFKLYVCRPDVRQVSCVR